MGTPVKVPPAAGSYSSATQDTDLRSQINMALLHGGHASKIQEHLLHSLNSHPSNWPSNVQAHALSILRSGEVSTFPALLRRVLDDIKRETLASANAANGEAGSGAAPHSGATTNGTTTNGPITSTGPGAPMPKKVTNMDAPPSLAVPTQVVEEALKVTQECLDQVCEVDEAS